MGNKVKIISNARKASELIDGGYLYSILIPAILSDNSLNKYFNETISFYSSLKDRIKTAKCTPCEIGTSSNDFLRSFVKDLKSSDDEKFAVVTNILKDRVWVSIAGHNINLKTNEVIKHEFIEKNIPQPMKPRPVKQSLDEQVKNIVPEQSPRPHKNNVIQPKNDIHQQAPENNPLESPVQVASSKKYIFRNFQAPGDITMMTAAIRDLHRNHPNRFVTDVRTNSMSIWENNEYIQKLDENDPEVQILDLEYPLIHQSNQGPFHFSEGFTEDIETKLGVRINNRISRGHIRMSHNEEGWGNTERTSWFSEYGLGMNVNYWILNAGFKNDFTAKMWPKERYQQVIDHFKEDFVFVQVGHQDHNHPDLEGVINLIGKTDDRQLIRLVWKSSGVLTPCSWPMVLAASVPVPPGGCNGRSTRPCVVIAGGREPSGWQANTTHQYIHTCGALPCCESGGCWISRIKPIGDNDDKDKKNMCHHVVTDENGVELPYCMDMITSDEVIKRIEMYYSFYKSGRKPTKSYNKR